MKGSQHAGRRGRKWIVNIGGCKTSVAEWLSETALARISVCSAAW